MKIAIFIGFSHGLLALTILGFILFQRSYVQALRSQQTNRIILMNQAEKICGTKVERFYITDQGEVGAACSGEK